MLDILFLIFNIFFLILIFFLTLAFLTGAPYVPTKNQTANKMLEFSDLKPGMKLYDLGSGDGKLLFMASYFGAKAVGFEINPLLVILTNIKSFLKRDKNTVAYWKNFWKADFSDADAVFVYLLPWRMQELEKILIKNLKKGSLVISNSFIFPNLKIEKQDEKSHVYCFKI